MKLWTNTLFALAFASILCSCGGGGSGSATPINTPDASVSIKPTVSGIEADQIQYRKITNFTVTGSNLDKGVFLKTQGCIDITELIGSSSNQKKFSCKIIAAGMFDVSLTDNNSNDLLKKSFDVALIAPPIVTMRTSLGDIAFKLNPSKAPITVDNFLQYVDKGFYNNKIFHRVIPGFIVQAGGVTADLKQASTNPAIKLEANNGLSNLAGSLAMARTSDPNSATTEFFINLSNNSSQLDASITNPGYAVFGSVVSGMSVINAISSVRTTQNGAYENLPIVPIVIYSAFQSQVWIDDVSVDTIQYRKNTKFTITGNNLDKELEFSVPACLKLTELPGGNSKQRSYSCKVISVGNFNVQVKDPTNPLTPYVKTFNVPLIAQPLVTMQTTMGEIIFELNPAKAPITVDNFLRYVESGFYSNKIFHRAVKGFVVQGGEFDSNLKPSPTFSPIKLEANNGLSNQRGSLAAARTAASDTATSQFYINLVDNSKVLDATFNPPGYAVFGKVIKGMDVIDAISNQAVQNSSIFDNLPIQPIVIISAAQTQ